jgi:hypothetical protein
MAKYNRDKYKEMKEATNKPIRRPGITKGPVLPNFKP